MRLRSTLVLGFVGLPTIGFHLDSFFKQGHYAQAAALLLAFYVLIGTRRLWARPVTVPILIIGEPAGICPRRSAAAPPSPTSLRFVTHDIVPGPLRGADLLAAATWANVAAWLRPILGKQVLPGVIQTLVLSQVALVGHGYHRAGAVPFDLPPVRRPASASRSAASRS